LDLLPYSIYNFSNIGSSIRIIREYERAVLFRLGRLIGAKGPRLIIPVHFIDRAMKIDK
jgi:regulator of protease activity HflC (stomatin/prohibitin superfamily)